MSGVSTAYPLHEKGSDYIIGNKNHHTGQHDCRGGGETDALGAVAVHPHMGEITLIAADGRNNDRKDEGFDKSTPDVNKVHGSPNAIKVGSSIAAQKQNPGEVPTQYPDEVKEGRQ